MRCIGTLEFVSDFHNKCHQTQRQLLLAKECSHIFAKDVDGSYYESDKENSPPPSNAESKEDTTFVSAMRPRSKCHTRMLGKIEKIEPEGDTKEGIATLEDTNETEGTGVAVYRLGTTFSSERKLKGCRIQGKSLATKTCIENSFNECQKARNRVTNLNRIGRRTIRTVIVADSMPSTDTKSIQSDKTIGCPNSMRDDRQSCGNTSNETDKAQRSDEPHTMELVEESRVHDNCKIQEEVLGTMNAGINSCKAIADTVETLNVSCINTLAKVVALVEANDSVKMPNDGIILTTYRSIHEASTESIAKSPRPGDEARGFRDQNCDVVEGRLTEHHFDGTSIENKGKEKTVMLAATLVANSGKRFVKYTDEIQHNQYVLPSEYKVKPKDIPEGFDGPSEPPLRNLSDVLSVKVNENKGENDGNYQERRRQSMGQFGKLAELITSEQKQIIETLYTVNMDVIDQEQVHRNIAILDKVKVKCDICGKTYSRMDKCQVHVWGHLDMKPYSCKSCDFVTLTVSNIRCHIRKRHLKIKPFQCNLCEKTYCTAVLLEEHVNSHTGAKPYKCKLCEFATSNRQMLSYHTTTHKAVKDVSCEVCGKQFFSNCRLRAHMSIHNKDRSLMCKFCSTYLCNPEALEKHYRKVHSREYVCDICGIRTRSRKALTNHENVHSAAKFRCPLCSKAYKSKHMLKEHLLKHQGIRKYKCELCHKSFAQQSHIAAHMSVHIGKRYPCPGCKKLFNRRDNMRIHTKRCGIFKSNPDMKNFSTRSRGTTNGESNAKSVDASVTADAAKSEMDSGPPRMDMLNGEADYRKSRNPAAGVTRRLSVDQFTSEDRQAFRISEVEIFPLINSNGVAHRNDEGNRVVNENVLGPECF